MIKDYFKRMAPRDEKTKYGDGFFNEKRTRRGDRSKVKALVTHTLEEEIDGKTVKNHIQEFLSSSRTSGEEIHAIWIRGSSKVSNVLKIDLAIDKGIMREVLEEELGPEAGEQGTLLTELLRSILCGTSEKGRDETVLSMRDSYRGPK